MIYVVDHTAKARQVSLDASSRDDLVSEIFVQLLANDRRVLRHFRFKSSLATYLSVIARRVVCRSLDQRKSLAREVNGHVVDGELNGNGQVESGVTRMDNRDEVEQLMLRLDAREADVVRMYHLEGRSYDEISEKTGIASNSIGPLLSRAREQLRQG